MKINIKERYDMMKIPKMCDVCGSPVVEGDYGDPQWLCTNLKCRKSRSNWMFEEKFEANRKKYNEISNKLRNLSNLSIDSYDIEIELHKARYIGEGSGIIKVKSSSSIPILFYLDNGKVKYVTDSKIVEVFYKSNLDLRLKEMWKLKEEMNSLLKLIK